MYKKFLIIALVNLSAVFAQNVHQIKMNSNTKYLFVDDTNNTITCKVQALCDITLLTGDSFQSWIFTQGDAWTESAKAKIQYVDPEGNQHIVLQATRSSKNNYVILVGTNTQYKFYLEATTSNTINNYVFVQRTTNNFTSANSVIDKGVVLDFADKTLYKNYKYSGDLDAPFLPKSVFNDGKKTYIELPENIDVTDLPTVYTTDSSNDIVMLNNARYRKPFFIIDAVLDKYTLVSGSPDLQDSLRINIVKANHKSKMHFWDRVFGVGK